MRMKYVFEKFTLTVIVPKEIELFMKAAKIKNSEILNKDYLAGLAEDDVFLSKISTSLKITILVHGFYLSSKKIFELNPADLSKKKSILSSSINLKNGWRMYYSFYE